MTYFFRSTRTWSTELWMLAAIARKKMTSADARRLSQRIDLTAQARQINNVAGEHRNRLDCSCQSSSPHNIAGGAVQGKCAFSLNTDHAIADNGWRGHHFAHQGFPAQAAGLSVERIKKTIFAANDCQVTRNRW